MRRNRDDIAAMVFDLGRAMRKKEEFESARLVDFEFRRRVRAMRLLGRELGVDEDQAAGLAAEMSDAAAVARLAELASVTVEHAEARYQACVAVAHKQLVIERGDPTPFRLM